MLVCCHLVSPSTQITKTSIMLGCGETQAEVRATLTDLRANGVDVVTFGQYLRPTKRHMKVAEFVTPEAFQAWKREAESMGFLYVAAGPLVRSSYKAGELFLSNVLKQKKQQQLEHASGASATAPTADTAEAATSTSTPLAGSSAQANTVTASA